MKRRLAFAAALTFLLAAVSPAGRAAEVVLKDGSTISVAKPYVTKGAMAILTRTDGSLVSVPLSTIDVEKTARSMAAPAPAPTPTPGPVVAPRPMTPAEAAKVKGPRKATVLLTDSDVAPGLPPGAPAAQKGEGEVSIGGVQSVRTKNGYSFSGTVVNSGGNPVGGVMVSIELVGEENKTITTGFGRLAKTTLGPGESAAFEAEIASPVDAKSFRYVPRWQVTVPVKPGSSASGGNGGSAQQTAAGPGEGDGEKKPAPKKPEPPKEQPTPPPPPPGYAAPQASAQVEGSTANSPTGAFLPRPADSQAKSPQ